VDAEDSGRIVFRKGAPLGLEGDFAAPEATTETAVA
jgi:hypothetical protein